MQTLKSLVDRGHALVRNPTTGEMIRCLAVSGVAAVVDAGSLFLLVSGAGMHYLVAGTIGFVFGLFVNYTLSVTWVFEHRSVARRDTEFAIFAAIGLVGLGLNAMILWFFTDLMSLHYMVSKLLSLGIVFGWNFGLRKLILFRRPRLGVE